MYESLDFLWPGIQAGDLNAFDTLFRELYPVLLNFSVGIIKKYPDAEEIVQDAFVTIWNNRKTIEIRSSLKSYLFQTVHNLSLNKLEHYKSKKSLPNHSAVEGEQWEKLGNLLIHDDIVEMIESKEMESIISGAIENLPAKCREIFILSRIDDLSYDEISTRLHISKETVRVQIFRALKTIGELIAKLR
jgi:RNA polymerase sigma-70 factor, ECF subfamily